MHKVLIPFGTGFGIWEISSFVMFLWLFVGILQVHNPWMPSDKTRGEESHDPKAVITTYEGNHNHDVPTSKSSRDHDTKPRFRPDETDTISLNLGVGISSDGPDHSHHT